MKIEQAAKSLEYNSGILQSNPELMCVESFKAGVEYAKNNLTVDVLDAALRMAGIQIHRDLLDRVIGVTKLIIEKGGEATIDNIEELKLTWKK